MKTLFDLILICKECSHGGIEWVMSSFSFSVNSTELVCQTYKCERCGKSVIVRFK